MHDQASAPRPSNPPKPQTTPPDCNTESESSRTPTLSGRPPVSTGGERSEAGEGISRGSSQLCPPEADKVAPWAPESRFPKAQNEVISFIRNILLTNPLFPKFYADVILRYLPKSREAKILRPWYQKILEKVNWKDSSMANTKTCTHIKVTGVRCGSPALYGESFCYFHQRMHRGVRMPAQARLHPIALIEDEESIQAALMEVINALMRNTIDLKRATLILRALHIAVKNAHRVKFGISANSMVREVPNYPEPERPPEPKKYTREEIEVIKSQMWSDYRKEQAAKAAEAAAKAAPAAEVATTTPPALPPSTTKNVGTAHAGAENVGTGAIGCPASVPSPQVATVPAALTLSSSKEKGSAVTPKTTATSAARPEVPPRKPVASAPAAAPKERKNAAQRASAG